MPNLWQQFSNEQLEEIAPRATLNQKLDIQDEWRRRIADRHYWNYTLSPFQLKKS